jgi:hypothetical protein
VSNVGVINSSAKIRLTVRQSNYGTISNADDMTTVFTW